MVPTMKIDSQTTATIKAQIQVTLNQSAIVTGGQSYWKAMTVKLNRVQYNALKIHGVEQNRTSQDCIAEAVDMWIAAQGRLNGE